MARGSLARVIFDGKNRWIRGNVSCIGALINWKTGGNTYISGELSEVSLITIVDKPLTASSFRSPSIWLFSVKSWNKREWWVLGSQIVIYFRRGRLICCERTSMHSVPWVLWAGVQPRRVMYIGMSCNSIIFYPNGNVDDRLVEDLRAGIHNL